MPVLFKKCNCNGNEGRPHGHFYGGDKGDKKLIVPVRSLAGAREIISKFPSKFEGQDITALEAEMTAAGIPEVFTSAEEDAKEMKDIIDALSGVSILEFLLAAVATAEVIEVILVSGDGGEGN